MYRVDGASQNQGAAGYICQQIKCVRFAHAEYQNNERITWTQNKKRSYYISKLVGKKHTGCGETMKTKKPRDVREWYAFYGGKEKNISLETASIMWDAAIESLALSLATDHLFTQKMIELNVSFETAFIIWRAAIESKESCDPCPGESCTSFPDGCSVCRHGTECYAENKDEL